MVGVPIPRGDLADPQWTQGRAGAGTWGERSEQLQPRGPMTPRPAARKPDSPSDRFPDFSQVSPGGAYITIELANLRLLMFHQRAITLMSRIALILPHCVLIPNDAQFAECGYLACVIAEEITQDGRGVLSEYRRGDRVGERCRRHTEPQRNIQRGRPRAMRKCANQPARPHLLGVERLGQRVDRAAWHARRAQPRIQLVRVSVAKTSRRIASRRSRFRTRIRWVAKSGCSARSGRSIACAASR